jgi:hypothetical protein
VQQTGRPIAALGWVSGRPAMFVALRTRGVRDQVNKLLMVLPTFEKNEEMAVAVDVVELVAGGFVLEATA